MTRNPTRSAPTGENTVPATTAAALCTFAVFLLSNSAIAQPWVTFDASLGSLPETQCWTHREDINPPMSYPFGVSQGDLHLSTLGFAATGNTGGGVWWEQSDVTIDFATDFAVEASVRIASAPDHSVNATRGWPRPGYTLAVYDIHGRIFWIGLGSGEIFLSNTAYGQYGSPNTVTRSFNTTGAHHIYRIERAAGGVGATLRIDGVPQLTLASLGASESAGGLVYFGDPTYWANSDSYTAWVRYSGVGSGPGLTGPLSALTCPQGQAAFSVVASGSGPFTYRWQLESSPGNWVGLGNDPLPLACGHTTGFGALTDTLHLGIGGCPATTPHTYNVRCVVSNSCGTSTSAPATLTICPADFNCDGSVDFFDYDDFVVCFEGGSCPSGLPPRTADFDGDGTVDFFDYDAFVVAFEAGC